MDSRAGGGATVQPADVADRFQRHGGRGQCDADRGQRDRAPADTGRGTNEAGRSAVVRGTPVPGEPRSARRMPRPISSARAAATTTQTPSTPRTQTHHTR